MWVKSCDRQGPIVDSYDTSKLPFTGACTQSIATVDPGTLSPFGSPREPCRLQCYFLPIQCLAETVQIDSEPNRALSELSGFLNVRSLLMRQHGRPMHRNTNDSLGSCFFNVEGRLIADRKVHGSGNEAECVDLLMQRGCEF